MPALRWDHISELGIDTIECEGRITPPAIAYVPGMRTDTHETYLIQGRVDHVRRYIDAGGDPAKGVCHFLTHDDYLLQPLWGPALHNRLKGFAEHGIKTIVAPDFSTWANWPVLVHLHNYYKSNVVCRDFLDAGYKIVCHPNFTHPKLYEFSASMWAGSCPTVLFDAVHSLSGAADAAARMQLDGVRGFLQRRTCDLAVWGRYPEIMVQARALHKRTFFVPSFVAMRAAYISAVSAEMRKRATGTGET